MRTVCIMTVAGTSACDIQDVYYVKKNYVADRELSPTVRLGSAFFNRCRNAKNYDYDILKIVKNFDPIVSKHKAAYVLPFKV